MAMTAQRESGGTPEVDPRVLRTRRALHEAISELATEQPFTDITIADIAGRAGVNRATVYAHYHDRDEILLGALEEQVAAIIKAAEDCRLAYPNDDSRGTPVHLVRFFKLLMHNRAVLGPLLGPDGSIRLASGIRLRLAEALRRQLESGPTAHLHNHVPVTLHADFLSGALLGVMQGWATSGEEGTSDAEQIAADTWALLRATAQ
jgi:AcrR family transcriptional regulator